MSGASIGLKVWKTNKICVYLREVSHSGKLAKHLRNRDNGLVDYEQVLLGETKRAQ